MLKIPTIPTSPSSPMKILWCLLIAATIVLSFYMRVENKPEIKVSLITTKPETVQVFCDQGAGFRENASSNVTTIGKVPYAETMNLVLPGGCKKIRIDLGNRDSTFTLLAATLKSTAGAEISVLPNIRTGQLYDATFEQAPGGGIATVTAHGSDPYVVLTGDFTDLTNINKVAWTTKTLVLLLIVVGFLYTAISLAKNNSALFTIVLIGVALRVLFFIDADLPNEVAQLSTRWPDEATYFSYVRELLSNGVVQYFHSPRSVEIAPGNIFYLASLISLFDGQIVAIRLFNLLVLSSAAIILVFKIAEKLFSYRTSLGAALLVAIYNELIVFAPTMLTEMLFLSSVLMFIYAVLIIVDQQEKRVVLWVVVGSVFGLLAGITRLVFLPVILLTALYSVHLYLKKKQVKASVGLAGLVAIILLGLTPFLLNGYKHSGHYMIATGSGAVLWLGSRSDTEGDEPPYRGKTFDTISITKGMSHLSLEGDRLLKEAAHRNIAADPGNYVWLTIKKIGRLITGNNYFWFFPQSSFFKWAVGESAVSIFIKLTSLLVATTVAIFGFAHVLVWKRAHDSAVLVYTTMLALMAAYLPFFINQRFGLPIFAIGSIFAAETVRRTCSGPKKPYFLALGSIAICIAMVIAMGI